MSKVKNKPYRIPSFWALSLSKCKGRAYAKFTSGWLQFLELKMEGLKMKKIYIVILALLLFLAVTPVEAQCAMCRAVLESEEGQSTAKGVNDGIVYLMIVPYILVGGLGYFIYRTLSKKNKTE